MNKIIEFYADWCGPCKAQKPILERFAKENEIELELVNIDEQPEMATKYGIRSIPAMIFFENGKHTQTLVGLQKESQLKELLLTKPH